MEWYSGLKTCEVIKWRKTLRFSNVSPAKVSGSKWDVHSVILNKKCTNNSAWWPGKIHFSFFAISSNNQKIKSREYACLKLYSPSGPL